MNEEDKRGGIDLEDLAQLLGGEWLQKLGSRPGVTAAHTSDLLSDVLANGGRGSAIITIQNHLNTVAVASQIEASCVILAADRPASEEMLEAAWKERIPLLKSPLNQFEISGVLYNKLQRRNKAS